MYNVEFLPSAARELARLERAPQRRIARRIDQLAIDPRAGSVKLRGADDIWRARVGDYRILCQIADVRLIIVVDKIGRPWGYEHESGLPRPTWPAGRRGAPRVPVPVPAEGAVLVRVWAASVNSAVRFSRIPGRQRRVWLFQSGPATATAACRPTVRGSYDFRCLTLDLTRRTVGHMDMKALVLSESEIPKGFKLRDSKARPDQVIRIYGKGWF